MNNFLNACRINYFHNKRMGLVETCSLFHDKMLLSHHLAMAYNQYVPKYKVKEVNINVYKDM